MTTATKKKNSTFPTPEDIAAAVHEHGIEQRRDDEARRGMLALIARMNAAADDPAPDRQGAYEQARVCGDWAAYEQVFRAHADWRERAEKRARMANELRELARPDENGRRHRLMEEAGEQTLGYLSGVLPSILDAARALDLEGVPYSAEAVIQSSKAVQDKYTRASEVVASYAALRRAQGQAVQDVSTARQGTWNTRDSWPHTATASAAQTHGQFRNAIHLDAGLLNNRRNVLAMLRMDADRRRIRRFSPGAVEFLDDVPASLFESIGADGFPVNVNGVIPRAAWLKKWSARLEFFVPSFDELSRLQAYHNRAADARAWKDGHGLVLEDNDRGGPASENAEALELIGYEWKRPDWDAPEAEPDAAVIDAAEANRAAAKNRTHPGLAA